MTHTGLPERSILLRLCGWLIASLFGAAFPVLAASALRTATRNVEFRIVTDAGFDVFQVSVAPVLAGLLACAALWEAMGRSPGVIGYSAAAAAIAFAFLETFFLMAYGAQPSLAIDLFEGLLLASFAAGGAAFALSRRIARSFA